MCGGGGDECGDAGYDAGLEELGLSNSVGVLCLLACCAQFRFEEERDASMSKGGNFVDLQTRVRSTNADLYILIG